MIFDETKISGKYSPETEVLTEVLRAILPDTDIEVTEHNNPYSSKEVVNKEHIQEDQEAPRYSIEELAA
jgi:glycine betaine/choline ABC-type transport system substrate-binding protein